MLMWFEVLTWQMAQCCQALSSRLTRFEKQVSSRSSVEVVQNFQVEKRGGWMDEWDFFSFQYF